MGEKKKEGKEGERERKKKKEERGEKREERKERKELAFQNKAGVYHIVTKIYLIWLWQSLIIWLNIASMDESKRKQKGRFLRRPAEFFYAY